MAKGYVKQGQVQINIILKIKSEYPFGFQSIIQLPPAPFFMLVIASSCGLMRVNEGSCGPH
jgi:hypothetical protein